MKYIEDLKEPEMWEELIEENNTFSLEEFYLNNGDGAVAVITPKQAIYAYSIKDHGTVVEKIYRTIYQEENFQQFYVPEKLESGGYCIWQKQATNKGNIIIQFCTGYDSIVWLPETINDFQYEELKKINQKINELEKENNQKIRVIISENLLPLNEMMDKIENRVDMLYECTKKEEILNNLRKKQK